MQMAIFGLAVVFFFWITDNVLAAGAEVKLMVDCSSNGVVELQWNVESLNLDFVSGYCVKHMCNPSVTHLCNSTSIHVTKTSYINNVDGTSSFGELVNEVPSAASCCFWVVIFSDLDNLETTRAFCTTAPLSSAPSITSVSVDVRETLVSVLNISSSTMTPFTTSSQTTSIPLLPSSYYTSPSPVIISRATVSVNASEFTASVSNDLSTSSRLIEPRSTTSTVSTMVWVSTTMVPLHTPTSSPTVAQPLTTTKPSQFPFVLPLVVSLSLVLVVALIVAGLMVLYRVKCKQSSRVYFDLSVEPFVVEIPEKDFSDVENLSDTDSISHFPSDELLEDGVSTEVMLDEIINPQLNLSLSSVLSLFDSDQWPGNSSGYSGVASSHYQSYDSSRNTSTSTSNHDDNVKCLKQ